MVRRIGSRWGRRAATALRPERVCPVVHRVPPQFVGSSWTVASQVWLRLEAPPGVGVVP